MISIFLNYICGYLQISGLSYHLSKLSKISEKLMTKRWFGKRYMLITQENYVDWQHWVSQLSLHSRFYFLLNVCLFKYESQSYHVVWKCQQWLARMPHQILIVIEDDICHLNNGNTPRQENKSLFMGDARLFKIIEKNKYWSIEGHPLQ